MKPRASRPATLVAPAARTCPAIAPITARERLGVAEQRGDVLEDDARLRVVGDVEDASGEDLAQSSGRSPPPGSSGKLTPREPTLRRHRCSGLPAGGRPPGPAAQRRLPLGRFAARGRRAPAGCADRAAASRAGLAGAGRLEVLRVPGVLLAEPRPAPARRCARRGPRPWPARRVALRLSARISGSRSFRSASSGVAMKIEEYVPTAMPTSRASARSCSTPAPPLTTVPANSSAATGISAISEVFSDRIRVWLTARFAAWV